MSLPQGGEYEIIYNLRLGEISEGN